MSSLVDKQARPSARGNFPAAPVKAAPGRAPASTGGYMETRKTAAAREKYADFLRRIHDPDTEYYGPVRGIITRSHTGIVGEFPSTKSEGLPLPFESRNELNAFLVRETDPSVCVFHAQPLKLWLNSEKAPRRYTADILSVHWNGRIILEEVKPKNELDHPKVRERHELAKARAEEQGWEFAEVTDEEVGRQPRLANAKLLVRYATMPLDPHAVELAAAMVADGSAATLGQLERELRPLAVRFVDLLGMAARGTFDPELDRIPLSVATAVRKPLHRRRYFR